MLFKSVRQKEEFQHQKRSYRQSIDVPDSISKEKLSNIELCNSNNITILAKDLKISLKKVWKKTRCNRYWTAVKKTTNDYCKTLKLKKCFLFSESTRIQIQGRHKNLYNVINGLIKRENNNPLPPNRSSQDLDKKADHLQTTQILYHCPEIYHKSDHLIQSPVKVL